MSQADAKTAAALEALRERFSKQVADRVEALARRWAAVDGNLEDVEVVRDLEVMAHNLAGAGTTFGYPQVSAAAQALEQAFARALDPEATQSGDPPQRVTALIEELERAAAAPPAPAAKTTRRDGPTAEPSRGQRLVLVADPDTAQAAVLCSELGHFGFRVHTLHRLDDLAAAVTRERPDIILMNIVSPGGASPGIESVEALALQGEVDTPVLFTSASDDFETRLAAVRAGASGYFVKPVDTLKLVERIDQLTARDETDPYRVLIVDDDETLAARYALALEGAGMLTEMVSEPGQVIRCLDEFNAELILMDLYLPKCSGLDLARVIRQQDSFAGVPIVFLSTEARLDRQLHAMSLGGDDFLTKPIEADHLVAAVASRAQRARMLRSFIDRDAMTGLLNHASTLESLEMELARAKRADGRLAFALLDLDRFKTVNDTYGHPTGDRVIKSLARLLSQRLRKTDLMGRYGGEEFALILTGATVAEADGIVDDLRERFAALRQVSRAREFAVTFSAGIAGYPRHGTLGSITEAADRALYRAKSMGRNRVAIDEPESAPE